MDVRDDLPAQNAAVVRWINDHSKRPMKAMQLWAELFTVLHPTTGEIMADRETLADRLGSSRVPSPKSWAN